VTETEIGLLQFSRKPVPPKIRSRLDDPRGKSWQTMNYPPGAAYINGQFVAMEDARISVLDWGFLHLDATYARRSRSSPAVLTPLFDEKNLAAIESFRPLGPSLIRGRCSRAH
jgi:hypothetical protein